ncbi:S-adenosyl-L-methionine-dependent methyltransferase [Gongronella butleri]|nr:S-adenosyl-L-methionine-dependent methyltransferase [Gongronella butleri]
MGNTATKHQQLKAKRPSRQIESVNEPITHADFETIERFRAYVTQWVPKWASDQTFNRLIESHFVTKHYCHGCFNAPVQRLLETATEADPVRILDPVCGNGIWAIEMAVNYPKVHCYGTDPIGVFPLRSKPLNTMFYHEDVTKGLKRFPDGYFDFIHVQLIYSRFQEHERKALMIELNRLLKAGGYIELRDVDPNLVCEGPVCQLLDDIFPRIFMEKKGIDANWHNQMSDYLLLYIPVANIYYQQSVMPLGWGDKMAPLTRSYLLNAIATYQELVMDACGWSYEDFQRIRATCLEELEEYHGYVNFHICWGQKVPSDVADNASDIQVFTQDYED